LSRCRRCAARRGCAATDALQLSEGKKGAWLGVAAIEGYISRVFPARRDEAPPFRTAFAPQPRKVQMVDPVRPADAAPNGAPAPEKTTDAPPAEGGFLEIVKVVVQALAIALVVRTFLFQPFNIPTGSLIPTLLIGDYLFVSKYAYGYSKHSFPFSIAPFQGRVLGSNPKRGDIAVFKLPRDGSTDYIKRVIGLPGDKIQMIDGRLYINGKITPRELAPPIISKNRYGRPEPMPTYYETLPKDDGSPDGVRHLVIEAEGDRSIADNTMVYEVPPGHFFMMGDNRDNSTDSRVPANENGVGPVPLENFVGRGELIFFSVDEDAAAWQVWNWPWTVRWTRIFSRVK
jgi:signal peptidase I